MKQLLSLAVVTALAVFVASAAPATTVGWDVTTNADHTTYTYSLTSTEFSDLITSFHVYAPMDPSLVTAWTTDNGWLFAVEPDAEIGGADIYWWADDPAAQGLAYGAGLQVSMTVPAHLSRDDNFVVPGYLGNWGYETYNFAGWGVLVSFPPVPVPVGTAPVPEPASVLALASGLTLLRLRRRT